MANHFLFVAWTARVAVCLTLLTIPSYQSQVQSVAYRAYGLADGLDYQITALAEDHQDQLWVATIGGLRLFDGHHFAPPKGAPEIVSTGNVQSLVAAYNSLWVGLDNGFYRLTNDGVWQQQLMDSGEPFSNAMGLLATSQNGLWVSGSFGLAHWVNQSWQTYPFQLDSPGIVALAEDTQGRIWAAVPTQRGHQIWRFHRGKLEQMINLELGLPEFMEIYDIAADHAGDIWVASDLGLFQVDDLGIQLAYTQTIGLGSNTIFSLLAHPKAGLWIGTGRGVQRMSGGSIIDRIDPVPGVLGENALVMFYDREGGLWIATELGLTRTPGVAWEQETSPLITGQSLRGVVAELPGIAYVATPKHILQQQKDGSWQILIGAPAGSEIHTLVQDTQGIIWVGLSDGLAFLDGTQWIRKKDIPASNSVTCLLPITSDELWVGTSKGLYHLHLNSIKRFTIANGALGNDYVISLWQTRSGDLWVGTKNGGASRYSNGKWTIFDRSTTDLGLVNDIILDGMEDKGGNIWFATANGLSRLSADSDPTLRTSWYIFDEIPLSHSAIFTVWEDILHPDPFWTGSHKGPGLIWIGTQNGISVIAGKRVSTYTQNDGLTDPQTRLITQDISGTIWIGTAQGLIYHHNAAQAPRLNALELRVNQQRRDAASLAQGISYRDNTVETLISASDLADLDNVQFYMSLEQQQGQSWSTFDDGWITQPFLTYQDLPSGQNYRLSVRAYDREFNQSLPAILEFSILRQTVWEWLGDHPVTLLGLFLFTFGVPILFYWYWDRWTMIRYPITLNISTRIQNNDQDGKLVLLTKYGLKQTWLPEKSDNFRLGVTQIRQEQIDRLIKEKIFNPVSITEDEKSYKEIGKRLSQYLLDTKLEDKLRGILAKVKVSSVRLRLHIPIIEDIVPDSTMSNKWLRELPWEYLCLQQSGEFLSKRHNFIIIRDPSSGESNTRLTTPIVKKVNILVACTTLNELPRLNDEFKSIKNSVNDARVGPVAKMDVTWEEFDNLVSMNQYQIIHFSGHGGYREFDDGGEIRGQNILIFTSEDNKRHSISQDRLVELFKRVAHSEDNKDGALELIVLNACRTAAAAGSVLNLAEALVFEAKVPAVVAMGYPISESAGLRFTSTFYTALCTKWHLEHAILQSRKSLDFPDWGIPRLYKRVRYEQMIKFPLEKRVNKEGD